MERLAYRPETVEPLPIMKILIPLFAFMLACTAGDWTLTVTDAATGVSASAKLAVRSALPPSK